MNDWPFQVRYLEVCEMWSNFHPDPDGIPLNPGPFCAWVTLGWRNFQDLWGWCGKTILKSAPGHWRQVANHFCWGFLKKKDRMEDVRIVHKCEFISAHRYMHSNPVINILRTHGLKQGSLQVLNRKTAYIMALGDWGATTCPHESLGLTPWGLVVLGCLFSGRWECNSVTFRAGIETPRKHERFFAANWCI